MSIPMSDQAGKEQPLCLDSPTLGRNPAAEIDGVLLTVIRAAGRSCLLRFTGLVRIPTMYT